MSENILKIFPTDPVWVPAPRVGEEARLFLSSLFPTSPPVKLVFLEQTTFVDPGAHLERIVCPLCAKTIEIEWWQREMNEASETHFRDLRRQPPCCRGTISLNDLGYEWPAGFAMFILEVCTMDGAKLKDGDREALEKLMGCKVREIRAHY